MVLRCLPCTGASTVPKTACNVELGDPGQPSPCPLTKEFSNADGEDYPSEFSAQGSPATQNGPEVYILPLTEVSLPMSRQPGRSVQLLKSTDLGRHSLLYLKEIGHGWFGKVFLGEVNAGLSSTQVVVKELKASASVQDQMQFLEEAQPYRALQHTNLLQCLAQCAEVTPYLLVMEFCPLGDLKGYLRSCHAAEALAPDPLTLQRMACEVSCGLMHLHRNNYVHSDLALRNCLLTADLTVKIGDYGLSHCKYKDDYFVTTDIEEEEDDTEDSDESDEELRCYNIQDQSEENDNDHLLPSCEPLAKDSWCYRHMITFQGLMAQPLGTVPRDEPALGIKDLRAALLGGEHMTSSSHIGSPCPDSDFPAEENVSVESAATLPGMESSADPLTDSRVESPQATTPSLGEDVSMGMSSTPSLLSSKEEAASSMEAIDPTLLDESIAEVSNIEEDPMEETSTGCSPKLPQEINIESGKNTSSEQDRTPDKTVSSASFPDLDEASDEDSTDLTSGVFIDFPVDCLEQQDIIPAFKTLQKQVGTPDSLDSLDIPSTTSSCDTFSPIAYISSSQPKALDSGYDTENYESPEFVLREPYESRESEGSDKLGTSEDDKDDQVKEQSLSDSFTAELQALSFSSSGECVVRIGAWTECLPKAKLNSRPDA